MTTPVTARSHDSARYVSVLEQEENRRQLEATKKIHDILLPFSVQYRESKTEIGRGNALYVALNSVHTLLASEKPNYAKPSSDDAKKVRLMVIGAAVQTMFLAKSEKHFERLFTTRWKPEWC